MDLQKPTAIVVGGGPVGLTAAIGFTRANIDFILLEQRKDVVVEEGSDLTLLPMTMRALDQMNLLEPLSSVWNPVSQIERIDHSGRAMGELRLFKYIRESTGYCPSVLSRRDLLQTLYRALPEHVQDNILTDKKVSKIEDTPDGIIVSCTDGTAYNGTFVIGADGAFSAVRECMRELALDAGSPDLNEAEPLITSYQALWARFPTASLPCCKPGTGIETHGFGITTQLFTGEETATTTEVRREGSGSLGERVGTFAPAKEGNFRLKDAYEARLSSGFVSLEEGVLPQWSWKGRVVLVGDAAHRFTPSMGSGLNYGIIDVVFLMNELHDLTKRHGDNPQLWWHQSRLSGAFETYQQKRLKDMTAGCQQASGATAMATWRNVSLRLLDQYVLPNSMVQWLLGMQITSKARATKPLAFDFE